VKASSGRQGGLHAAAAISAPAPKKLIRFWCEPSASSTIELLGPERSDFSKHDSRAHRAKKAVAGRWSDAGRTWSAARARPPRLTRVAVDVGVAADRIEEMDICRRGERPAAKVMLLGLIDHQPMGLAPF